MAAASVGNIAVFAGGHSGDNQVSDAVDIYNAATNTWTTATLSEGRSYVAGTAVGSKILIAGGAKPGVGNSSNVVDIYDTSTGNWTTANLSLARAGMRTATVGDKAFFAGGGDDDLVQWYYISSSNVVDIYDDETGTWYADAMQHQRINHAATSAGNQFFVAGGISFETFDFINDMEIFTDTIFTDTKEIAQAVSVLISPNPFADRLSIRVQEEYDEPFVLQVFDLNGKLAKEFKIQNGTDVSIDLKDLPAGSYVVKVFNEKKVAVKRLAKI
jgi:hypothetical protein